jgi:hypothetical protein
MPTTVRSRTREKVVPLPVPRELVGPAKEYFATGVTTSQALLRERGHFDAYAERLSAEHRDAILALVPGTWAPIELALEHYLACDRLDLPREEILDLGEQAAMRLYSPAFVFTAKLAASAGVTPWAVIRKLPETIKKSLRGGGAVCAYKLGPKEVRIEFEGHPLAASSYVRTAFVGTLRHPISFFCRKAVAREILCLDRAHAMACLISWV